MGLNVLTSAGVWARGNTWKPSVQGADAAGNYAAFTANGPVDRVAGQNYAVITGGSIQF